MRREFAVDMRPGGERLIEEIRAYLRALQQLETADFEIYHCSPVHDSPLTLEVRIRYDFVGTRKDQKRERRIGSWRTLWSRELRALADLEWIATEENVSRAVQPIFVDITSWVLGQNSSYQEATASWLRLLANRD